MKNKFIAVFFVFTFIYMPVWIFSVCCSHTFNPFRLTFSCLKKHYQFICFVIIICTCSWKMQKCEENIPFWSLKGFSRVTGYGSCWYNTDWYIWCDTIRWDTLFYYSWLLNGTTEEIHARFSYILLHAKNVNLYFNWTQEALS